LQALKKATTLPADVIAIDLEDAVAPAMKVSADATKYDAWEKVLTARPY
jgi:citrate lyase beta subunit